MKNPNWQKQDLQNTSPGRLLDLHSKVWQLTLLTVMFISILSKFLLGLTRTLTTSHDGEVTPKGSHHQSKLGILLIRPQTTRKSMSRVDVSPFLIQYSAVEKEAFTFWRPIGSDLKLNFTRNLTGPRNRQFALILL